VDQESDNLVVDFHSRRLRRRRDRDKEEQSRFDRFLGSLRTEDGIDLSAVWAEKARVRPTNYDYIFILTDCKWDRGKNFAGYISMNVNESRYLTGITTVAGKNALLWNPPDPPRSISHARSGRALHEIAHSFGLGDEYASQDEAFTGTADDLKMYGNLQLETDAQTGGEIKGDQIKWNWRRARKGALVRAEVTSAGGDRWTVKVKLGHGSQFSKGNKVILRKRSYPSPLGKDPMESAVLEVAENPTADEVIVSGSIAPALKFVEGDVLYMPTEAPASVKSAAYPFAELVAHNIKKLITDDKRPLSTVPCSPAQSKQTFQVPDLGAVVTPLKAADKPRIVGLYYGGAQRACGIFHPAGKCMMASGQYDSVEFCAVCRYILVEIIDPSRHFAIDLEYDAFYPQQ
jgi:hypothetical protein